MKPETIISLISVVVAFFAVAITYINSYITLKHQRKIEVLKVVLDAAYKEYEFRTSQLLELAKETKENVELYSFTEYLIFYTKISETITKKNLTEKDMQNALKENKVLIDSYYKYKEQFPINRTKQKDEK
jgi:hypothetical protein